MIAAKPIKDDMLNERAPAATPEKRPGELDQVMCPGYDGDVWSQTPGHRLAGATGPLTPAMLIESSPPKRSESRRRGRARRFQRHVGGKGGGTGRGRRLVEPFLPPSGDATEAPPPRRRPR
jgi:hypothetical protein